MKRAKLTENNFEVTHVAKTLVDNGYINRLSDNYNQELFLDSEIGKRGTLDVLRNGIKDRGAKFELAYFKPVSGLNPEHEKLYKQNRFSVIRQIPFSERGFKDRQKDKKDNLPKISSVDSSKTDC